MKFFDRVRELADLREIRERSESVAQFTVVTGRRRVGKTSLVVKSLEGETYVYLFVERKSEKDLCETFAREINEKLGDVVLGAPERFEEIFGALISGGNSPNRASGRASAGGGTGKAKTSLTCSPRTS